MKKKSPKKPDAPFVEQATEKPVGEQMWLAAKTAVQMSGLGFYFVAVVGVCVYLGMLADDYFSLGGSGRMAGILAGFPVAIFSLWKNFRRKKF